MTAALGAICAILVALGLWKASRAGRDSERADQTTDALREVDDARAARDALRDPDVRDSLRDYREDRDR